MLQRTPQLWQSFGRKTLQKSKRRSLTSMFVTTALWRIFWYYHPSCVVFLSHVTSQRTSWADLSDSQCVKECGSTKRRQSDDLHANDAPGCCCNACLCKNGSCPLVNHLLEYRPHLRHAHTKKTQTIIFPLLSSPPSNVIVNVTLSNIVWCFPPLVLKPWRRGSRIVSAHCTII